MKMINNYLLLLAIVGLSYLTYSCTEASAADKAEAFLTALANGDLESAQNMAEKDTKDLLKKIKKSEKKIKKGDSKVIILGEDSDGEEAVVRFRYDDSEDVNVLHLSLNDKEGWQIAIDDKNEDIMIGDQSMKDLLYDLNTTLQRALEAGALALDQLLTSDNGILKIASELLKMGGDAASQMADSININSSDFERAIEKLKNEDNPELEKAKEELKKAAEKLKEIFEEK